MTLNVLFLAAEAEPFVKIGGLGDVAGALPDAIRQISSSGPSAEPVDIRVVLPFHYALKQRGFEPAYLGEFRVNKPDGEVTCKVYLHKKEDLPVYFLDGDPINQKLPVYSSQPIIDGEKFIFFSIASLGLAKFLNFKVDILHTNDWHTAAAIYALKFLQNPPPQLLNTKTVHTVHNLPFMGFGVQSALFDFGLPPTEDNSLPEWARHVPLPLGLLYADTIVPVSPHYAEDILTPDFGCGLENFLKTRKHAIQGIINGLDVKKWNPADDPEIAQTYTINSLSKRPLNKFDLQQEFNLEQDLDIPLLTLVSRMDPQKGIDIALDGLHNLGDLHWQVIILGTGEPKIEKLAVHFQNAFPNRVRTIISFDSKLAHRLYAGADIFVMPSRTEPCGLSQMIAMRYGCVPVAHATGGLVDTITPASSKTNDGTGFLFESPHPSAFSAAMTLAFKLYSQPEKWRKIQLNGMKIDFSWRNSAEKYIDIYYNIINDQ